MLWHRVSAREAALAILHEWFGPAGKRGQPGALRLTAFQEDAVMRIESLLRARKGALLADSVGLGKTFVALAVIETALRADQRVLVVLPAALRRHWQQHLRKLPAALRDRPRLFTHTALSFGRVPTVVPDLLVVDEAHAFRNPRTRRYETLSALAKRCQVLLLTATPINNALDDLYHLVRLFATDHAFADLGVADLRHTFARAGKDPLAQRAVERVVEAVVVRRTRAHVAAAHGELSFPRFPRFPQRAPPQSLRYDLVAGYGPAWPDTYGTIEQLRFACVAPALEDAGIELMRLQLLKRLESSTTAFALSLQRLAQLNDLLFGVVSRSRWIEPAALRNLVHDGEVGTQLPLEDLLVTQLPRAIDRAALLASLDADRVLLQRTTRWLRSVDQQADPKLDALKDALRELGPGVLVFTQYRDTAVYLWKQLLRFVRVGLVHGDEARLGAQRAARTTVIECFAPTASGARAPTSRTRVDVLIATDVLSEGLNLQDAHTVVNYDLPWNPVTLMQRMGRVDRLGSSHEHVHLFNFLPDRGLDEWLGLLQRVERKLHVITRTVGADGVLLDGDQEAAIINAQNDLTTRGVGTDQEIEGLRARWLRHATFTPGQLPVIATIDGDRSGWLFAFREGDRLRLISADSGGQFVEDRLQASRLLSSALDTLSDTPGADVEPPWSAVTAWLEAERCATRLTALKSAPETQAANLLLRALNHHRGNGPTVRKAGRLLRRLESPLEPDAAVRLSQSLQLMSGHDSVECLVTQLEAALGSLPRSLPEKPATCPVAALRILAPECRKGLVDPSQKGR